MANFSSLPNIVFDPLHDEPNISAFRTFTNLVKSCIGPKGKLKIIQNASGGHVIVTSSSSRLFQSISIKNNLLKFVLNAVKIHLKQFNDGGLYCVLLTLKLIENCTKVTDSLPVYGIMFECFGKLFLDCFQMEKKSCILKLNLTDLNDLQSIAHSVFRSKPGCLLSDSDVNHLSMLLLKAFLNIIPCSNEVSYCTNVNIVTSEGTPARNSKIFNGLLIERSEINEKLLESLKNKNNLKIILFTMSLSGDADFPVENIEVSEHIAVWEIILKKLQVVASELITEKVDIVACQKVVHPRLRKQFQDAGVLVVDRLGFVGAKNLEMVSGITAVSSLATDITYGSITSLKEVAIDKKHYLLLSNEAKPFYSLLLCGYNEEVLNETKVTCQQVLNSLFQLLKKPYVCFGAGCSEIYTIKVLEKKVKEDLHQIQKELHCSSVQILSALQIFIQTIVEVSISIHQGTFLDFVSENIHNHLWKMRDGTLPSENDKCMCGQYLASSVDSCAWSFFTKPNLMDVPSLNLKENAAERDKSVILDEFSHKVNAYMTAFETAATLLKVSLCIHKNN